MPGYFDDSTEDDFGVWLLDRKLLHDDDVLDDEDRYIPDFVDLEDDEIDWDDEKDENLEGDQW